MKVRIIIKGKVHNVGYRPFLLGLAESLEIERFFADNIKDGKQAVEILVDDVDEKVNSLVDLIKKKRPENAEVESIDVEDYDGRVMRTESYYRYLTAMQLAKIATYGGSMLEKQDKMLEKQDIALSKMDGMLQKQDETIRVIGEESEKTRQTVREESEKTRQTVREESEKTRQTVREESEKTRQTVREESEKTRQTVREESEKTTTELKSEIRGVKEEVANLRIDLKEYMELNLRRIHEEIAEIKGALKKAGIM